MDPVIPTATAAVRAIRMRCLFEVIREIGFLKTFPLMISLCGSSRGLRSFVGVTLGMGNLPVEDEVIHRVQQAEESNAVDDRLSND